MSKKPDYKYDPAAVAKLSQPFNLHCMRLVGGDGPGGRTEPIQIPPGLPDHPPGQGWTAEMTEAKLAEIIPALAGGGHYHITAIDVNGSKVEWRYYFNTLQIPEKVPPNVVAAQHAAGMVPTQARTAPPAAPQGFDPLTYHQQMLGGAGAGAPNGGPLPSAYAPAAPSWPQPGWAAPPQVAGPRNITDDLWAEKEQRIRLEMALDQQRQAQALARAEEEARELRRKVEEQNVARQQLGVAVAGEGETVRALREQNAQMQARFEAKAQEDKFERMMMGMQQQTKDMMAAMQLQLQAQAQANAQQLAALQQQIVNVPRGPDPALQMVIEMSRQQQAAHTESMRQFAEATKANAVNALTVRDVMDLSQKVNDQSGLSTVAKTLNDSYAGVAGLAKGFVEMAQSMMGGNAPSTVEALGGQALQAIQGTLQQYLQVRQAESTNEARVKTTEATTAAQTAAYQAQVNAQVIAAQAAQAARAQAAGAQAGAQAAGAQAAGAQAGAQPPSAQADNVIPISAGLGGAEAPVASQAKPKKKQKQAIVDKYELDLFGSAVEAVRRLRVGVMSGASTPEAAAGAVQQGVAYFKLQNAKVPIFELFEQRIFAKLCEALVPDAPLDYRRAMAQELQRLVDPNAAAVAAATPVATGPDEEEDEEGDGDVEGGDGEEEEVTNN